MANDTGQDERGAWKKEHFLRGYECYVKIYFLYFYNVI